MSCGRPIRVFEGLDMPPGPDGPIVCGLPEHHGARCVDTVHETNPWPEATAEVDKFFGELDAGTATAFHATGMKAQSYSGAGAGVFDECESNELHSTLCRPSHRRKVEQLDLVYRTMIRLPLGDRQTLAACFSARQYRIAGENDLRKRLTFGRGTVRLPHPFFSKELARVDVCLVHLAVLQVGGGIARFEEAIREVSLGRKTDANTRLIRQAKFRAWQTLAPALEAYHVVRNARLVYEADLARSRRRREDAELDAEVARLQRAPRERLRAPARASLFDEQEAAELRALAAAMAHDLTTKETG